MTHIYREIQPSNYAVSKQGTIWFRIRVRHVMENPLTETGQPMTNDDEPLVAWTEHDIFIQPKEIERAFFDDMERYHKYEYEGWTDIRKYNLVTRLFSDAAFDDYDGSIGKIDLLDEINVRFLTFA